MPCWDIKSSQALADHAVSPAAGNLDEQPEVGQGSGLESGLSAKQKQPTFTTPLGQVSIEKGRPTSPTFLRTQEIMPTCIAFQGPCPRRLKRLQIADLQICCTSGSFINIGSIG